MRRFWWKAYFFFVLVLTLVGSVVDFYIFDTPSTLEWWDWLVYPLYLLQFVGLYGFAYLRPIAIPAVWRATLGASLVYESYSILSIAFDGSTTDEMILFIVGMLTLTTLFQGPLLYAIYRYGFRSGELWRGAT
jgi:hypothetical protein